MPLPKDPIKAAEARKKMSEAGIKRMADPEIRKKMRVANVGRKQSKETIEKRVSQLRRENHPRWKGGNILINCQECGKEFEIPRCGVDKRKFCSRTYHGKWMSKHNVGENNPLWNGGEITKKCEECEKEFTVEKYRKDTARFCSPRCKGLWLAKSGLIAKAPIIKGENHPQWKGGEVTKKCQECGKEFSVERSREKTGKFCSIKCHGVWMSKNLIGEDHPNWHRITKTCEECGKDFIVQKKRDNKAKFCSQTCRWQWMSKNLIGEKVHNWKGGSLKKLCEECGKEFIVERAREKSAKYCSPKCRAVWMSKTFIGENNWNLTGGSKEYCEKWSQEFRRRIRAFFDHICAECGTPQNEKLLHCHHVYYDKKACCSVNENGKYFSNLGIKGHPHTFEIVGDPNKFIALCDNCHKKTGGNKNREYWARHFEEIINNYYLGRSYFTKEEYEKIGFNQRNVI
jgi:Zn-finger nucleic acid-binding protein